MPVVEVKKPSLKPASLRKDSAYKVGLSTIV